MGKMSFSDQRAALAMRDTIEEIARGVVNRERPRSFVGTVVSIDVVNMRAEVLEAGSNLLTDDPIEVRFAANMIPGQTGISVEVSGSPGQFKITRIVNGSYHQSDATFIEPFFLDDPDGTPKIFKDKVSESPLNTLATPTDDVDLGGQKLTSVATATLDTEAPNLGQVSDMISDIPTNNLLKGTRLVSFSNLNADTSQHVNFTGTFLATPVVMTNITSTNSNAARWSSKAVNIDTTGFDLILWYTVDTATTFTWSNIGVQWLAMG